MAKYLFGIFRINKRSRPCCLFAGLFKKHQQIQYQCQWSRYRMDFQKILALLPSASFLIANRRHETNVRLLQWSDHIKFIHVEKVRYKNQSMVIHKKKKSKEIVSSITTALQNSKKKLVPRSRYPAMVSCQVIFLARSCELHAYRKTIVRVTRRIF